MNDPADSFLPSEGKLGQLVLETPAPGSDGAGPRLEFFLEIAFRPFEWEDETLTPLLRVDRMSLPSIRSWRDLENTTHEFPFAPKPGSVEAAIPLFYEQNPADVTRIEFGDIREGTIAVRFEAEVDFEIEADREDLGQVGLQFDLPLKVEPLRVSTGLEKRLNGEPADISDVVGEAVDRDAYGVLEKVPGGFQFPIVPGGG